MIFISWFVQNVYADYFLNIQWVIVKTNFVLDKFLANLTYTQ